MIVWMGCVDEPKKVSYKEDYSHTIYFSPIIIGNIENGISSAVNYFRLRVGREPKEIRGTVETLRKYFHEYSIRGFASDVCGIPIVENDKLNYGALEIL